VAAREALGVLGAAVVDGLFVGGGLLVWGGFSAGGLVFLLLADLVGLLVVVWGVGVILLGVGGLGDGHPVLARAPGWGWGCNGILEPQFGGIVIGEISRSDFRHGRSDWFASPSNTDFL
jgi:hypothetical protein